MNILHGISVFLILFLMSTESFAEMTAAEMTAEYVPQTPQITAQEDSETRFAQETNPVSVNYNSIFYGPALKGGDIGYVPHPDGGTDYDKPVQMKHYLGIGYNLSSDLAVSAVSYLLWQPFYSTKWTAYDPYVKISHERVIELGYFKVYADFRFHLPVSEPSKEAHLLAGMQTVQVASYDAPDSRWTFNLYGSARTNFFGKKGYGSDLELYLGPNIVYQLVPKLGLTLLYEFSASHRYGAKPGYLTNDGTDFEPGLTWDVTPNLNLNPYLNFYPGNRLALDTTSFGMLVNWKLL